jgi:antitoxin component YwqK of YwqJK toxin-antitoxin module
LNSYLLDEEDGRIIEVNTYANGYLSGRERLNRKDKFGQRQGMWRTFHSNMVSHEEGRYRNDKKDGYWREYDESGNLVQTLKYENGLLIPEPTELARIDIKRTYHPNAQVKSVGSYLKGTEEGVHRFFSKEGVVESAKVFRAGKVVGEGVVDPEGRRQGKWKEYYDTGELSSEGSYKDNRREGEWVFFYRDGKEEQRGGYRKGLPDGDWRWLHHNGQFGFTHLGSGAISPGSGGGVAPGLGGNPALLWAGLPQGAIALACFCHRPCAALLGRLSGIATWQAFSRHLGSHS